MNESRVVRMGVLLVLLFSFAALSCLANGSNWMATIDSDRSLAIISIPGSHDSGARHNFLGLPETAKCQTLSIGEQLNAGVRFLDIRCKLEHGHFGIYHGFVEQCLSFETVEQTCVNFLKTHPGETVLMTIQNEGGPNKNFASAVDVIINRDSANWFTGKYIPRLKEVRQKIVLVRRFAGKDEGIDATSWLDNECFPIVSPPNRLWVQDRYIVWCNESKWRVVERFCRQAETAKDGALYLNFASGSNRTLLYPRIRATSRYVNPRLAGIFRGPAKGHYGVVIMDFVTPKLCSAIYGTNPEVVSE